MLLLRSFSSTLVLGVAQVVGTDAFLGRVLPRARQHAVVEERRAVRVVAQLALLGVLHDRVVRHLLLHLELRRDALGDLAHEVDDAGARAGRMELEVVPRGDRRDAVGAHKVRGEAQLAVRLLRGRAHVRGVARQCTHEF